MREISCDVCRSFCSLSAYLAILNVIVRANKSDFGGDVADRDSDFGLDCIPTGFSRVVF